DVEKAKGEYEEALRKYQDLSVLYQTSLSLFKANNPLSAKEILKENSDSSLAETGRPSPVRDAIVKIFVEVGKPQKLSQLHETLNQKGMAIGKNNVWMALKKMEEKGIIRKRSRGLYHLVTYEKSAHN
ncbi:MAG: hypothetical protein HY590_02650, partial [Candidatus Omnitrophica bacterium]|nr:hypothetical protein [Candidatus Omnitrophota bacterium]